MKTGGEGSLEILDLEFGKDLHGEEAVMGTVKVGRASGPRQFLVPGS